MGFALNYEFFEQQNDADLDGLHYRPEGAERDLINMVA